MNKILASLLALALVLFLGAAPDAAAQTVGKAAKTSVGPHGPIDTDGDGIPNHSDPDYTKPRDGSGHKFGKTNGGKMNFGKGNGFGPGDGTGNSGIGPRDGSGLGRGNGTGVCDGTGPKGKGRGR